MAADSLQDDHHGKGLKPPNRKKYEEDVELINASIRAKEAQFKSSNNRTDDKIQLELHGLRREKELVVQKRQTIDADLGKVNQEIIKQEAELTRVQSNLPYRNEAKINEAIQRLDSQLKTRNFRLNEERKIVAEIDSLKRSKKDLGVYQSVKKLIDEKRDQQRRMRDDRDKSYKELTKMKGREEVLKQEMQLGRDQNELHKQEVYELRRRLRQVQAEFAAQEKDYNHQRDELHRKKSASLQRAREEKNKAAEEAYHQELLEYESCHGPYCEERQLCSTLVKYLHKYLDTSEEPSPPSSNLDSPALDTTPMVSPRSSEPEGMHVLRRKVDDEDQYRPKTLKKSKKEKKKPTSRKTITHTPEIFAQFSRLALSAPLTHSDIQTSVSELEAKQNWYESLGALSERAIESQPPGAGFDCDTVVTSCSTSAIGSSIPTTPDVQFDGPRFPRSDDETTSTTPSGLGIVTHHRRTLSKDSGSGDPEDSIPVPDVFAVLIVDGAADVMDSLLLSGETDVNSNQCDSEGNSVSDSSTVSPSIEHKCHISVDDFASDHTSLAGGSTDIENTHSCDTLTEDIGLEKPVSDLESNVSNDDKNIPEDLEHQILDAGGCQVEINNSAAD